MNKIILAAQLCKFNQTIMLHVSITKLNFFFSLKKSRELGVFFYQRGLSNMLFFTIRVILYKNAYIIFLKSRIDPPNQRYTLKKNE